MPSNKMSLVFGMTQRSVCVCVSAYAALGVYSWTIPVFYPLLQMISTIYVSKQNMVY